MKKFFFLLVIAVHFMSVINAQKKATQPVMPDVNRLMAMSPAQREQYADSLKKVHSQMVVQMASQTGMAIDETVLPGFDIKPPKKDLARLALIPSRPPSRTELVAQLQKSKEQLQAVIPKPQLQEIEKFSNKNNLATLHETSIAGFYNNEPEKALYLMMNVASKQPDSIIVWNNLAAMYNHVGMQHRAAPMLQYCLQHVPGSSLILNNLGQSFMGMGDLVKAKRYFIDCLNIDSLNPDANHSMGLMHMFDKEFDEAMKYFNRELAVAVRSSTLAYAVKMGKKVNLRALQEQKNALNGRKQKDFFEEISLGKFKIPTYPQTVPAAYEQIPEYLIFGNSVQQEAMFWLSIGQPSKEQIEHEGKTRPGLFASLVNALLDELHEEFTPEYLSNMDEDDLQKGLAIFYKAEQLLANVVCPEPPQGSSIEAQIAYEIKCCKEKQQPIRNQRLMEYSGFWRPKIDVAQQRWKSYINQLIAIVQLDPSSGNQLMVYRTVSAYFTFLGSALLYSGTGEAVNKSLIICDDRYDLEKADSVINADRNWRLQCPAWLNIEVDVEVAKIKADCSKYGIEAGSTIMGQYEYNFKTGSSTLAAGVGVKAKFFKDIGKASIKQMAYITFDNNNQLADYGILGKAEVGLGDTPFNGGPIKVGGTIAGIKGEYQLGINSGYTSEVKGIGVLAEFVKINRSL